MAPPPWPRSLRSPLWFPLTALLTGMAIGWLCPGQWPAGVLLLGAMLWRRLPTWAVGVGVLAGGAALMQAAAAPGRDPGWAGTGCFTCSWQERPAVGRFGWRVEAMCRGNGRPRRVRLEGRGDPPACVGEAVVWGRWRPWQRSADFDEAAIYGRKGLAGRLETMESPTWLVARDPIIRPLDAQLQATREQLSNRLNTYLSPRAQAFLWGISTGDKSELASYQRSAFSRVGLAHVLAVSGYHVGLIGFLPLLLARSKRQSLRWFALLGIPIIGGYVHFCGDSDSALRAWGMASLILLGAAMRRPVPLAHSWCMMGWMLAVCNPLAVVQLGTQLSFLAVLGIALGLEALGQITSSRWGRALTVPLAAQSATAPIAVPTFGQFPSAFLPVNLVAGPWVTAIGFSLLAWLLWPTHWPGFTGITWWLDTATRGFMRSVEAVARWNRMSMPVPKADAARWWAVGGGIMALALSLIRPHQRTYRWGAVLLLMSWPWWPMPPSPARDWELRRGRHAQLVLGEQVVHLDSLSPAPHRRPFLCRGDSTGLVAQQHAGDTLTVWGVNRHGTWCFRVHERRGMGRLEINGHSWVWERWHAGSCGRWPP